MMKKKGRKTRRVFVWIGISLLVVATVLAVVWQWRIHAAQRQAEAAVKTIREAIPTPQGAVPEERRDNTMVALSVSGTDYVGLLEMPRYDSVLPVGAEWGNSAKHPCRFSGSVYDRTLQIGTTSQKGQYDFYREISVGDAVYFTDMEGNRYAYTVTNLQYTKHADKAALNRDKAALTVFVKNSYAFEYLIISCRVAGE